MRARWAMSSGPHSRPADPNWMKQKDGSRPEGTPTLHHTDVELLKSEIARLGAKTVLEFGPGSSTKLFAELGLNVTTIEHMERWYQVALEMFKDYPNVRVLKGEDEMPFVAHGLGADERFDFAFVDAPQGYKPLRKIHPGYEDTSRFNTTLLALQHSPVVLLHDATRPCERGTLMRLHRMGYAFEYIPNPYGVARITHGDKTGIDLPGAQELGGAPAGAGPGV